MKTFVLLFCLFACLSLLLPNRAYAQSVKIMTFNVLRGPLCYPHNHEADLQTVTNFVRSNNIKIAALQEVIKIADKDCHDFDMVDIFRDQFSGTGYNIYDRQYISVQQGSWSQKWYRLFIHTGGAIFPIATSSTASSNSQGAEAIVLDTNVGRIRFINLHPQPGTQALNLDKMLLPFIDQFRSDGIPMVLMGDFNLRYDRADAAPVLKRIEDAGFYRACDPAKFPNGNCHDTVTTNTSNFAIDHIFIDKRATFIVKNAYVEQSMRFSDHLPVIVELGPNFIPNCYNLTGPSSIRVGSSGTYSATVYSPQKELRGEIFRNNLVTLKNQWFGDVFTATIQTTWTPTTSDVGTHTVHCRAWNNAIAECRPPAYVDKPPRYPCEGPNYSMTVSILPAFTPTPTRTPTLTPTRTPTHTPTVTPTPLSGDTDGNRTISLSEWLSIFRLFYFGTATYASGDADKNGIINSFDYRTIRISVGG